MTPEPKLASTAMTMTSVQVLTGPGIVARYGDVLLWLEEGEPGRSTVPGQLLDLARALADGGDSRQAGGQVAEVLRSNPQAVPALVLVAPTSDGLQAVVHGWGRVLADGVDIDGGWADRELPWTTALAAGRGGDLLRVPSAGSVLDLRRGSAPGGGAAVALATREPPSPTVAATRSPGPADRWAPQPAATPAVPSPAPVASPATVAATPDARPAPAPFSPVDLRAAPARREPLPVGGRGGAVAPTSGVTVKGVVCSRSHFNNPIALFCGSCGISMGQITRILQDGIRPSLGTLVLDDGTAFGLDTDHLVGSAPHGDPAVADGGARPLPLNDPTGQTAPVHAEVRLVGWDVLLVARAPTFVLAPGTQQWAPAPLGQPNPLPAGARVAVGQRTFVVESNARNSGI